MRKKILYVITKSVWGGAQRYVYDLATNLPRDNFEVTVVAGEKGILVEKLRKAGVRTIALETLQKKSGIFSVLFDLVNIRLFFNLFKLFLKERPDVIHLNSSKAGGIGAIAAFIFKTLHPIGYTVSPKVIFTVHGWPFKENRPLPSRALIFFLSWLSSLFHDRIILINTADLKSAEKFVPPKKRVLIFNGVEEISFFSRQEARTFFSKKIWANIAENDLLIGTVAELTKNKGLHYLIDAIPWIKDRIPDKKYRILILGEGEERQNLQSKIRRYGLEKTIFLVGFIPDAKCYLKGLDLFVLPSLKEGLPYTIIEAMQAGLPLIATEVGGIPDIIEHGKDGCIIKPKNSKELAEKLTEFMERPELYRKYAEKAFNKSKKFSLQTMIEKTITIYEKQ
jgi:glycosyltransferase involved in cell wall biosynthesis